MTELLKQAAAGTRPTRLDAALDRLDYALQAALTRADELETGFHSLTNESVVEVDRRLCAIRAQMTILVDRSPEMIAELRQVLEELRS
jgi:hypothetical protein